MHTDSPSLGLESYQVRLIKVHRQLLIIFVIIASASSMLMISIFVNHKQKESLVEV